MAFPTKTTATATATSSPISVAIQSPASGDLVLVFVATNRASVPDLPSDWTSADSNSRDFASDCAYRAFYKVCDGSEGANISVTAGSTPTQLAAISYKVLAGTYTGVPEVVSVTDGNTSPNPPNLAPSWGTAEDTLWIAGMWNNASIAPSVLPSDGDAAYSGTTVNAVRMYTQHAEKNASSENPPTYTLTTSQANLAFTAAIRGVSGGGGSVLRPYMMG